jgi:hypothetical protein
MSDIQSNYPRTQVAISSEKVNLVDVADAGSKGVLAVLVILLLLILVTLGPWLGLPTGAYGLLSLIIIGAAFPFFVNLYKWSSQAHYALCLLKGYSPRISSPVVGIGSAISIFIFAVPIWLTFDFLITYSDPSNSDPPTISWSPAALKFFIPYVLCWLSFFARFLPIWSPLALFAMTGARYLLITYAVWNGCKLVNRININLQSLARIVREQTAPALTTDPE